MRSVLTTFSFLDPTTIDSVMQSAMHSPQVSAVIGGIGLGNLFYHLPRFRKEKAQTIGIGALTAGYLLDSASHMLLAGSSIGALGVATVGLLAGGTALATYAGLEWAGNNKSRKSFFTTVAVAGFGALHFGSHVYMAIRALLGTVVTSASLFGAGVLGLVGNLGLVSVATYTLFAEIATHGHGPRKSERAKPVAGKKGSSRTKRTRRGLAILFGSSRTNAKVLRARAKAA